MESGFTITYPSPVKPVIVVETEDGVLLIACSDGFIPWIVASNVHPGIDPSVFPVFNGRARSEEIVWQ